MAHQGENSIFETLENSLLEQLRRVPFLNLLETNDGHSEDAKRADIRLMINGAEESIIAKFIANGEPSKVRTAVLELTRMRQDLHLAYYMVCAPYISSQSAEICLKENVGFCDSAGNCHLSFGNVYIHIAGGVLPRSQQRALHTLYSPKAERILRVMLSAPELSWQVTSLARTAQVSIGQSSKVKALLADKEWLRVEADGLHFGLKDPGLVLSQWAQQYKYERNRPYSFYSLKPTAEVEYDLAEVCKEQKQEYALTGLSGAVRLAAYARYQRATAYVNGNVADLAQRLDLKAVTTGANVILLTPYDEGVYHNIHYIGGVAVASPVQVYLDLQSVRGRGEEAAQYLLEEVIKPSWEKKDDGTIVQTK